MRRGTKSATNKAATNKGQVRIIGGKWRGRKLSVLDAQGLRPTTDRTKETLFNWLMHACPNSRGLDLFAGSGGLGFEALSRYAKHITFVEKSTSAAKQIAANMQMLGLDDNTATLHNGDALQFLQQSQGRYDLVFLDPPFSLGLLEPCIELLSQSALLEQQALVYVEREAELSHIKLPDNWQCHKQKCTQHVIYALYQVSRNDE